MWRALSAFAAEYENALTKPRSICNRDGLPLRPLPVNLSDRLEDDPLLLSVR